MTDKPKWTAGMRIHTGSIWLIACGASIVALDRTDGFVRAWFVFVAVWSGISSAWDYARAALSKADGGRG